jgi:hypothetical protein
MKKKVKGFVMNNKKIDKRCPDLLHGDDGVYYSISCYGRNLTICYQRPREAEDVEPGDFIVADVAVKNKNCSIRKSP